MARKSTKKRGGIKLDLSNVGKPVLPDHSYLMRVIEATEEEGPKAPYFKLKLTPEEDGYQGSYIYDNLSTSEAALHRLRHALEAFGFDLDSGEITLKAEDFVDRLVHVETFLDRYDGGTSVKVGDYAPADEDEGVDDDDEDDDDEDVEFDLDSLDDDEVKELAAALDVKGRGAASLRKKLAAMDEDDVAEAWAEMQGDEDGGDEDDDDEDDELSEDAVKAMKAEELEALVADYDLEIDLSKKKTLKLKQKAVIAALEEEGYLED